MSLPRDMAWQNLDHVYRSSVSYQFARYALGIDYDHFPPEVMHAAKRCLLDALGCAIGGFEAPGRQICEATIRQIGGPEEATLFGSGLRTSAMNATIVNCFMLRFLDYMDIGGGGHNSEAIPSILAIAEKVQASGKDFLSAMIISYELGARFLEATGMGLHDMGWSPEIRGGLNVPPAIGKLLGLNEDQIAHAIAICMSHALPLGITDANLEENSMMKNLRFGWTTYDAILSCLLAKNGFTGPLRIVEGDCGLRQVVTQGKMDLEKLVDFSGWRILKTMHKPLAANMNSHGHMLATLAIVQEQNLKPEDIAAVKIKASRSEAQHTTTFSKKYPRNAESADHSAFYETAIIIKERAFGPEAIQPEKFTDPVILGLIEKITVETDPGLIRFQGISEITTKDGRVFKKRVDVPHGLGDDPLTDQELETKFRTMADKHMPKEHVRNLLECIWNVDKVEDVHQLTRLMIF